MTQLLQVDGVSKSFGGLLALSDVSFGVDTGEVVGIIGPNGAGKSTLFGIVAGALRASAGRIHFNGADVTGWTPERAARMGVGRTFQLVRTFGSMTVAENVLVGAYLRETNPRRAAAKSRQVLERVGLATHAERAAKSLPIALKRRLELARALATDPSLLLLDEVLAGLSPTETESAIELIRSINAGGLTIVLVEHVMEVVMSLCGRLVVLDHGRVIAEGDPPAVAEMPAVIQAYFGPPDA